MVDDSAKLDVDDLTFDLMSVDSMLTTCLGQKQAAFPKLGAMEVKRLLMKEPLSLRSRAVNEKEHMLNGLTPRKEPGSRPAKYHSLFISRLPGQRRHYPPQHL